ncbi:hypothetical protein SRHO_G00154610 [Serrasalmus rhombeus]
MWRTHFQSRVDASHRALSKVKGTSLYLEVREEALAEDLPGFDFRGGLVLLPSIFRENVDHLITLGEVY